MKFILEFKTSGEIIEFKSLRDISKLLNIEYHQIRSIYNSKNKKFVHPVIKHYCDLYDISYNPALLHAVQHNYSVNPYYG